MHHSIHSILCAVVTCQEIARDVSHLSFSGKTSWPFLGEYKRYSGVLLEWVWLYIFLVIYLVSISLWHHYYTNFSFLLIWWTKWHIYFVVISSDTQTKKITWSLHNSGTREYLSYFVLPYFAPPSATHILFVIIVHMHEHIKILTDSSSSKFHRV